MKNIHGNEGRTFAKYHRKGDHDGLYSLRRIIQCICRRGRHYIETDIQTREYHSYTFIDRDINLTKASLRMLKVE